MAGFRYDPRQNPAGAEFRLPDVERKGFVVFVDLVALARHNRGGEALPARAWSP